MELHVAQADITTLPVDAVIMPCTSMGTVTEPIRTVLVDDDRTAIELELKSKAPLALGAAMLAGAEALTAGSAILVPIKKHDDDNVATEHLRRAVKAALIAANVKGYETLALPNMVQSGGKTTTRAEAARAIVQEIRAHAQPFPETIYLVDDADDMVRIFEDAIQNAHHSL
jgi:O-acetyl-ADP-ribose deacetylase (regulator of RNase III)